MDSHVLTARTTCSPAMCSHFLRFLSLFDLGRGVAVPCDEAGNVDIDALTERARCAYLGARALVGREYACPTIKLAA